MSKLIGVKRSDVQVIVHFNIIIISICFFATIGCNQKDSVIGIKDRSNNEVIKPKSDTILITYGKYLGECSGYCKTFYRIKSDGIDFLEYGWDSLIFKPRRKIIQLEEDTYKELLNSISVDTFFMLNNVIGCPDCNDGGAEWIEIRSTSRKKRITFENGAEISAIRDFLRILRQITNN